MPASIPFRPPSVPLIAHDPCFSVWLNADRLTDDVTRHWTGEPMAISAIVRVDGQAMRVIGNSPKDMPAMKQVSTQVLPTRTICEFEWQQIRLTLTFLAPALMDDLELLSTPITYVIWNVRSNDGQQHDVTIDFSADASFVRHDQKQAVVATRVNDSLVKLGTKDQPVLKRVGDRTRIDWGHLYLTTLGIGSELHADERSIRATLRSLAIPGTSFEQFLLIGYDDDRSIVLMDQQLKGYWKRNGATIEQAFERFEREYQSIRKRCEGFDADFMDSLRKVGGEKYALLCALAHRQSIAGSKLVADANGMPLWFPKENSSNGCMATTDVFFPQIPHLLLFNNDLAKATVVPILEYAASPRWKFPFAPHDLGTYPIANGQVYGGGEKTEENQMPVEESGNMLLIVAAICKADGNAEFSGKYWPQLTQWAKYLETHGVDPTHQLCTDDFAGHLARNANLSIKAILGMKAYAQLADLRGERDVAKYYHDFAAQSAQRWMKLADDGDHYTLAFGKPGTWSQKYNLVWDEILDMNVFPREVKQKELAFYRSKFNKFGLPLDSRKSYTKTDWEFWTATLADDRATFEQYVDAAFNFANETPDRVPFSDWYDTITAKQSGFQARPVIGGLFMPMLKDREVWKRWRSRAKSVGNNWAKLPTK